MSQDEQVILPTHDDAEPQEVLHDSDSEEDSAQPLNYADAIALVYDLVDEEHCPEQPLSKRKRVKSLVELGQVSDSAGLPMLPHSSTVKSMAEDLECNSGLELSKKGSFVPQKYRKQQGNRSYKVHTEFWPTSNPVLEKDSQKVRLTPSKLPAPIVSATLIHSLVERPRQVVPWHLTYIFFLLH